MLQYLKWPLGKIGAPAYQNEPVRHPVLILYIHGPVADVANGWREVLGVGGVEGGVGCGGRLSVKKRRENSANVFYLRRKGVIKSSLNPRPLPACFKLRSS